MTNDATSATATPAAPRYSQSLHLLVDEPTRATALGLAIIAAEESGGRPKEGETIRGLIESSLERIRGEAPSLHARALEEGRKELAARAALAAAHRR